MELLKKQYFKRTHFSLVFTDRQTFVGEKTGVGNLFYQEFFRDNKYRHIKEKKRYIKLALPKNVNEVKFYQEVRKVLGVEEHQYLYLFVYEDKYNQFSLFKFSQFEGELDL